MQVLIRNVRGMSQGEDLGALKPARLFDLGIEVQQHTVRVEGDPIQVFYWFPSDEAFKVSGLPDVCPYCVPA